MGNKRRHKEERRRQHKKHDDSAGRWGDDPNALSGEESAFGRGCTLPTTRSRVAPLGLERTPSNPGIITIGAASPEYLGSDASGVGGDSPHSTVPFQFYDLYYFGNLWYVLCCIGYCAGPYIADWTGWDEHVMGWYGLAFATLYVVSALTFWIAYETTQPDRIILSEDDETLSVSGSGGDGGSADAGDSSHGQSPPQLSALRTVYPRADRVIKYAGHCIIHPNWNRCGEALNIAATIAFLLSALIGVGVSVLQSHVHHSAAHTGGGTAYGWWKFARYCDGLGNVLYVANSVLYWRVAVRERIRVDRKTRCHAWFAPLDLGYWSDVTNLAASLTALWGWCYAYPYLQAIFTTCDGHSVPLSQSQCWIAHQNALENGSHPQFANVGSFELHANYCWLLNALVSSVGWYINRCDAFKHYQLATQHSYAYDPKREQQEATGGGDDWSERLLAAVVSVVLALTFISLYSTFVSASTAAGEATNLLTASITTAVGQSLPLGVAQHLPNN